MIHAEFLSERAALYSLLSRLFTYPLEPGVLSLVAGLSVQESSAEGGQAVMESLTMMQKPVLEAEDLSILLEALNREATRLFEGPGQPVAPPYGSFYLNGKRLMGPEAIAVRKAYLDAQMLPDPESRQPPDHLALELGFLAALANTLADETISHLRRFIADHLLSWIPVWKDDVMVAKPHPFFRGLVNFTQASLEDDLAWLDENDPLLAPVMSGAPEERK